MSLLKDLGGGREPPWGSLGSSHCAIETFPPCLPILVSAPPSPKTLATPKLLSAQGPGCVVSLGPGWPWARTQKPKAKGIGKMAAKLEVHVPLIVLLFILSKYPSE